MPKNYIQFHPYFKVFFIFNMVIYAENKNKIKSFIASNYICMLKFKYPKLSIIINNIYEYK